MRILVISNLYPPHYIGGYELGCQDVVEALKDRGHEVKVLTSTYGIGNTDYDGEIYRWLQAEFGWRAQGRTEFVKKLFQKEVNNQIAFRRLCATFNPDVVYVWNLMHVSISLVFVAQRMKLPICYFVFDNWLSRWEGDSWYSAWNHQSRRLLIRFGKRLFRPMLSIIGFLPSSNSIDLRHVQFASQYLKQFALQAGKPVTDAEVTHYGIDVNRFSYKQVIYDPKRLLYVGQIVPHKGVHTVIEAMKMLFHEYGRSSVNLNIVGGSMQPDYVSKIRNLVHSYGLTNNVHFTGFVPREHLQHIYQEHDILVFPSVWDEPFGIAPLEAMSCGLAVVGTATGGNSEILQHDVNALVFPKENGGICANQVLRLLNDPELFERIRRNGRRTVEKRFRAETMMDRIEKALQRACARGESMSSIS